MNARWLVSFFVLGACRSTPDPSPETQAPVVETTAPVVEDVAAPTPEVVVPKAADEWWRDAVGYEIFVRSFQDSNGDGIGDFKGIEQRLDYLTSLGVDLVWLMPIHPSPSYHGYDVTDYRAVNAEYGTMEDFDALIAAAKKKGIRIIIDMVLNHSSDRHPWFIESKKGPTNPKYTWYSWKDEMPTGWTRPWDGEPVWHEAATAAGKRYYYGVFWGGMPDLNVANPDVQNEMEDVMAFWFARGLAGFRIDAIRYLIERPDGLNADTLESHAYIKGLRARANQRMPGAVLLGEAWTNAEDQAAYHGDGDELHLTFSFDMAAAIVETTRDGVRSRLNQMLDRAPMAFKDRGWESPFLTNHDMARVAREMSADPLKLRVAAAIMLASPGTPFLYYGEELGMVGGAERADENKRTPMRWTADPKGGFTTGEPWWTMADEAVGIDVATQSADPGSLLSLYRKLGPARRANEVLRRGDQTRIDQKAGKGVVTFLRTYAGRRVLVVANVDKNPAAPFTLELAGTPNVLVSENLDAAPTSDGKLLSLALGARSFAWIALD